jgi:hypothetical protein
MMKYAGMHADKFTFPKLSALIALLQLIVTVFVELVNILNLTFIGDIKSLVVNYVALGEISAFDEYFLMMYQTQSFVNLIQKADDTNTFLYENFIRPKIWVNYTINNDKSKD